MVKREPLRCTGGVHIGGIATVAWASAEIVEGAWHALSAPFPAGMGILSSQSMGQVGLAIALGQVLPVQRSDPGEVVQEQRRESGGKGCEPILSEQPNPNRLARCESSSGAVGAAVGPDRGAWAVGPYWSHPWCFFYK
jgi:hypothetical protein